jgi:hypothetical protein
VIVIGVAWAATAKPRRAAKVREATIRLIGVKPRSVRWNVKGERCRIGVFFETLDTRAAR